MMPNLAHEYSLHFKCMTV
uniref:Uncharacterized protein n=1 Tax=Arundo donax TaxID=35708 RepID=A0A0A9G572_ARUDO